MNPTRFVFVSCATTLLAVPVVGYAQPSTEFTGNVEVRSIKADDIDLDTFVDTLRIGAIHDRDAPGGTRFRSQIEFDLPKNSLGTNSTDEGDVNVRKALVSLKGGFGETIFGRQNNILADTKKIDQFKNGSGAFLKGPDRVGNAISYVTPDFSGVHAYLHVVTDEDANSDNDADGTVFGINYSSGDYYVGISRMDVDDEFGTGTVADGDFASADLELTSFGFSAGFGDFTVFGTAQDESIDEYSTWGLGVAYGGVESWTFKLAYAEFDDDPDDFNAGFSTGSQISLLAAYDIMENVGTFIQYLEYDSDAEAAGSSDAISVGIHLNWSHVLQ